jgi:hypothetical protein
VPAKVVTEIYAQTFGGRRVPGVVTADRTRYATHVVPMGNYVITGVGNYVIENPSNLGNYVIADA